MTKNVSEYASCLVPLNKIERCFFESRTETADDGFDDLVESIKKYGVLQPIGVRPKGDGYELFAGDRRFRAAKEAGLKEIPVVIRDLSDEDALVLQATENLQRQGLSAEEKTRIVSELARRCNLDAQGVADRLGMSYSWVCLYLPSEYKNGEMARVGQKGGEALAEAYRKSEDTALSLRATCEFCGAKTSESKEWNGHILCLPHYSQALEDPALFKRHFGFQQQQPVFANGITTKPLNMWEESDRQESKGQAEMIETVSMLLLEKGIKPIILNRKYSVSTTIHMVFPNKNLALYLDDKNVQNVDGEIREWLRQHHGMRVLSIVYRNKSVGEKERIVNEIVREVNK